MVSENARHFHILSLHFTFLKIMIKIWITQKLLPINDTPKPQIFFSSKEKLANHICYHMVHQQSHQQPLSHQNKLNPYFTGQIKTIIYGNALNFLPPDVQNLPVSPSVSSPSFLLVTGGGPGRQALCQCPCQESMAPIIQSLWQLLLSIPFH